VERGAALVERSGTTLDDIVTSVHRVSDIVAAIAAASEDQRRGIDQVNRVVVQMDEAVQNNAGQTEELSSTAQALARQARDLEKLVGHFKVARSADQSRPASPVVRAQPSRTRPRPSKLARHPVGPEVAMAGAASEEL